MRSRLRLDSIYTVFIVFSISMLTLGISYLVIITSSYISINKVLQSFAGQYKDFRDFSEQFGKEKNHVDSQYTKAKAGYFFPNGQALGTIEHIPLAKKTYIEWYDFLQARWLRSIPITIGANEQGTIRITYPVPLRQVTLSLMPFIIFSLLLSWLTLWYTTTPLHKLIKQAQSINPKAPKPELLDAKGPFEIRQLSLSLRQALITIKKYQESIEEQHERERERYKWFHHELTQPNALAVGTLQLALPNTPLPSEDTVVLQSCLEETSFILSALANYLGLSDLTIDNPKVFDLKEVCLAVVKLYPGVKLNLLADSAFVQGSEFFIRRVLHNLLYNARRVVSSNSDINIALSTSEQGACLQVSDKGPGIPEDVKPLLFKGEIKVERKKGGRGIGLWYAKRLIDLQSGSIDVTSNKDGGACFTIKLPLVSKEVLSA